MQAYRVILVLESVYSGKQSTRLVPLLPLPLVDEFSQGIFMAIELYVALSRVSKPTPLLSLSR